MKTKRLIPALVVVAMIVIVGSQYPKLKIATGYGAKAMATAVFVAGREPDKVQETDLNYSIVKYTKSKVDFENKIVTTSFWGLSEQKAVYREGLGCCLVGDLPVETVRQDHFSIPQVSRPGLWRVPFPDGDALSDTLFGEVDTVAIQKAVEKAFDSGAEYEKRTAAVAIVYKGKLIAERYDTKRGITPDTRLWGWSMNKSINNAMAGVLARKGKLSVNSIAPVKEWQGDQRRDITINDLMHMSSGLKWDENYGDVSSATRMLYLEPDCYKVAIDVPFSKPAGTYWYYSSGTANILSGIIRQMIGNQTEYLSFPYREIFNKIGMSSMILETDAAGTFIGSSYGYATAKDWARFGLLYLNDGVWKGDTVLARGWVTYTRQPVAASKGEYGAQFWLNSSGGHKGIPTDMFSCEGHRGQRIFIIPSRHLVVVRLGFSEERFDHDTFLREILSAIH